MKKEMSSANDIAKRFELLEHQWMDFQRRSTTPDLEEEPIDFPSSLPSFDASANVSSVTSQATTECPKETQSTRRSNIVLPRPLKPFPQSSSRTSTFSDQNQTDRKCQDNQPDSPLSSSSTLSSSSSSSSSCSSLLHNDPLNSRRKRLFSEPHTPIKETIFYSPTVNPSKNCESTKNLESFLVQRQTKAPGSEISDGCPDTHQSRSPPPGSVSEELEFSLSSKKGSPRSLLRKITTQKKKMAADNEDAEIPSGTVAMQTLRDALMEVVVQLESKEKCLQDAWKERKETPEFSRGLKQCAELESLTCANQMGFEGLSLLVEQSTPGKWCELVSNICQRLISYLQKETLLQKWAISLEKEVMRVLKLEEGIVEAKVNTAGELEMARKMKKHAEESNRIAAEEREGLVKDREALVQWVAHLQDRQKAVNDQEREVAMSIEELKSSAQQVQEDQEAVNNLKLQLREKEKAVKAKEREAESQIAAIKEMQADLRAEQEQLRRDKFLEEKGKAKAAALNKELEDKLKMKERDLGEVEIDLAEKVLATENLSRKLVAREKVLNEIQSKAEQERGQIQEALQNIEKEKKKLHVSEVENELSKKNAQEILSQIAEERKKTSSSLKRTEEKLKAWEESLKDKEKDLQRQESLLKDLETQLMKEQERSHTMHAKLIKDQEAIMAEEDDLNRKEMIVESKTMEARKELDKLNRERKQVLTECKRLTEMEARIHEAERALEIKQREHQKEVDKQSEEYQLQVQDLEAASNDLDQRTTALQRRFDQFQIEKQDFEKCKREAEEDIERVFKEKDELHAQQQKLRTLQRDIEKAGAEMINHVMVMDKASSKLEAQRHRIDSSQQQLRALADGLMTKHKLVKEREEELNLKEQIMLSSQDDLRRLTEEAFSKSKNLKLRECEIMEKKKILNELESRLEKEREAIESRFLEDEERIALLEKTLTERTQALTKAEKALTEEKSLVRRTLGEKERSIQYEKERLEEQGESLLAKRREMSKLEAALKKKEEILEEQSCTLLKLEADVKERMQRVENMERKSTEVEKDWEDLREEQEALLKQKEYLGSVRAQFEQLAATQRAELQDQSKGREEVQKMKKTLEKQQIEAAQMMEALRAKEVKAAEKESAVIEMEHKSLKGRSQIEKDAEQLRQQLTKAHAELEAQRRYVEDRQKAVDAAVVSLKEEATKLNARKREVEEREQLVQALEERQKFISDRRGVYDKLYGAQTSVQEEMKKNLTPANNRNTGGDTAPAECRIEDAQSQGETDSLIKERENLKVQQLGLEKTKLAIQEAKTTLTVQLKASKKMVADASLIAQKASREREALEEERKLLAEKKQEIEASLSAREMQLTAEAKRIESMTNALEEKIQTPNYGVDTSVHFKDIDSTQIGQAGKRRQIGSKSSVGLDLQRTFMNTNEDSRKAHIQPTAAKRGCYSIGAEQQSEWKSKDHGGLSKEERLISELRELRRWPQEEDVAEMEQDIRQKNNYSLMLNDSTGTGMADQFSNLLKPNQGTSWKPRMPSPKRLENVMTSLIDARQASRSRLQRTENALMGLPASAPSTSEVKRALQALSARLSGMEQVEEELACQLKEAYEAESAEVSEGAIVDKVELLCRMEEQQNLRAEWEQDMQRQLEKISMLQSASSGSSCYDSMISMESVDRALSPMLGSDHNSVGMFFNDKGELNHSFMASGNSLVSPDWNMTSDGSYGERDGVSASPLVDYSSVANEAHPSERNARRKLLSQYGAQCG